MCQAIDVRFPGTVVAALDGVLEKAADAIAVVLVILGGVDTALSGDRVRTTRAVLVTETGNLKAHFSERRGGGRPREARAHDNDVILPAVGWAHEAHLRLMVIPLVGQRAGGDFRVEIHGGTDAEII